MKKENNDYLLGTTALLALVTSEALLIAPAEAVRVEPTFKAVGRVLGSTKVVKKAFDGQDLYYVKEKDKAKKVAVIAHALWQNNKNCTHEWVIGIDYPTNKVTQVVVTEFGCPHAEKISESSFLDQFKGKGPADIKGVKRLSDINTVVKATGSADLTNEEVVKAIALVQKNHAAF